MKLTRLTLFLFVSLLLSRLQAQEVLWAKSTGGKKQDVVKQIVMDKNGDLLQLCFLGTDSLYLGKDSLYLIKRRGSDGEVIWSQFLQLRYQENNYTPLLYVLSIDHENNVFYLGNKFSHTYTVSHGPTTNTYVVTKPLIGKINGATGAFIWTKNPEAYPYAFGADKGGDLYISWFWQQNYPGPGYLHLVKINGSNGAEKWRQTANTIAEAYINNVVGDEKGNVYISGTFRDKINLWGHPLSTKQTSNYASFIVMLDDRGLARWALKGEGQLAVWQMTPDKAGNLYCLGGATGSCVLGSGTHSAAFVTEGYSSSFFTKVNTGPGIVEWVRAYPENSWDKTYYNIKTNEASGGIYAWAIDYRSVNMFLTTINPFSCGNNAETMLFKNMPPVWGSVMDPDMAGNLYIAGNYTVSLSFANVKLQSKGAQDIFITKLSIPITAAPESCDTETIQLIPNPVDDKVMLRINKNELESYTLRITDAAGKTIKKFAGYHSGHYLDLEDLAPGLYFVIVNEDSGGRMTAKLLKR